MKSHTEISAKPPVVKKYIQLVKGWARITIYLFQGIIAIPSKVMFGNASGFYNNVYGLINLFLLQRASTYTSQNKECHESAATLRKLGYLFLDTQLDSDSLNRIKKEVQDCFSTGINSTSIVNGATKVIADVEKIKGLNELFTDRIKSILREYYGCDFCVRSVEVWRNHHVENVDARRTEIFSNTFHQDAGGIVTGVRIFFLLKDGVSRKNGALRFHDRIESTKLIRYLTYFHRYLLTKSARNIIYKSESIHYFEGNLGKVCIMNPHHCLHAASIPEKGTFRDMCCYYVEPNVH